MHFFQKQPLIKFIIYLALFAFFIKVPAGVMGVLLVKVLDISGPFISADLQNPTLTLDDMILAVVLAPVIETFIGQMLPIEVLRKFTMNQSILITFSGAIFMIFHYPVLEFFPAAFAVGAILSWAWIEKRNLGMSKAFVIVTLIHSLHNALAAFAAALYF